MQAKNLSGGQELICINVDKVYDWIVKERSFDFVLPTGNIVFTPTAGVPTGTAPTTLTGAVVTCEVTPDPVNPVIIVDREDRPFVIDGTPVTLQQLNIRKNFVIRLCITLADGTVLTSAPSVVGGTNASLLISRCEVVTMCAPEGTDVEITYTDLDCFICTPGVLTVGTTATPGIPAGSINIAGLTLSIVTCQSIQSTFPVTVEFLAEFCEPREELATECPAPIRPLQCPVIFP
ncbi:hypothetical protein [Psychrobacillus lasiicapitis]|uniref:Uncharacterized protein n=1 Tax=Psychrobacillus lasiicapitis TaxID=1636719 RepID=A0A544T4W6_9BACI|nr:hypothetical protein [Psychrobacillus lasiicapitis]TQR12469.1 hypothetical protein FG382_12645 [Psychrobacillus lasiicapitis]GGA38359.1 hypothetical protein GCM10011384_29890 [Psychrobacillus lasiicapitis]